MSNIGLIKKIEEYTLGQLCSLLAEANINIYHYENQKWWTRANGTSNSKDIDSWDEISRSWNERRSQIKNQIDSILKSIVIRSIETKENQRDKNKIALSYSFQVLPISLMIDMLTIENIKIYDLASKNNEAGVKKATARKNKLQESIDDAINKIVTEGKYELQPEARTF